VRIQISILLEGLETVLCIKGLSFASPERLIKNLGITPGAVKILIILVDNFPWECVLRGRMNAYESAERLKKRQTRISGAGRI
jgi:hypothetical protein